MATPEATNGHQPDITPWLSSSHFASQPCEEAGKWQVQPYPPNQKPLPAACSLSATAASARRKTNKVRTEERRGKVATAPRIKACACAPAGGPGRGPTGTTSALRTLSVAVVSVPSSQSTTPVRLHCPWLAADERRSLSSRLFGRFNWQPCSPLAAER